MYLLTTYFAIRELEGRDFEEQIWEYQVFILVVMWLIFEREQGHEVVMNSWPLELCTWMI